MCKRVNKQVFAVIIAVLALSVASPAFAGQALTGTIQPAPPAPVFSGQGHGIPLTGTISPGTQAVGAINGTQAITGITGQALTGTTKTVNIPIPLTGKSIPLSGTISGSRATGILVGVNLFNVRFP